MDYPNLLVVVLSGRPEVRREALAAGADAFVSKVDPPERLLAALHAMDSRSMEMETQNRVIA
jgi:DNA-binding NarL/FixJ family response regulator